MTRQIRNIAFAATALAFASGTAFAQSATQQPKGTMTKTHPGAKAHIKAPTAKGASNIGSTGVKGTSVDGKSNPGKASGSTSSGS
jgi:hypothetical protein